MNAMLYCCFFGVAQQILPMRSQNQINHIRATGSSDSSHFCVLESQLQSDIGKYSPV